MNILTLFSGKKKTLTSDHPATADVQQNAKPRSLVGFLSDHYAWVLILVGVVIISEQAREHLGVAPSQRESFSTFMLEVVPVFILLGLVGMLIRILMGTLAEKTRALKILNVKHDLTRQLSTSQDVPEVSKSLLEQVALIVPDATIELYIHEQAKDWFIRVKHDDGLFAADGNEQLPANLSAAPCQNCILKNHPALNSLSACQRDDSCLQVDDQAGFCLPLVYSAAPVGLLLVYSPDAQPLAAEQSELLGHLSGEMAQAIGMLIEKKAREDARLTEKIHTVQLDIARDLHDTVGQNISYLRMKLDHLSESNNDDMHSDLIMEIRSMSKVANESYDLVRGTLAVLQADDSADLLYLFSRYAEQVSERSSFTIDFSSQGTPRSLSASRMRHLFYIFREALSNIEKHANASQVRVQVSWEADNLGLLISDNGRGYDLSRTQKVDIHYGLKFMRERAALLNGSLIVHSAIGVGTSISVLIPRE